MDEEKELERVKQEYKTVSRTPRQVHETMRELQEITGISADHRQWYEAVDRLLAANNCEDPEQDGPGGTVISRCGKCDPCLALEFWEKGKK